MRVPVANTLGTEGMGFQQQMAQFVIERMWANYSAVGGSERAIRRTADYLRERQAFGKPLIKQQYIQFKLAELTAEIEALKQLNYATAAAYQRGEDPTRLATISKWKAGKVTREVADWVLQFHGGIGYMEETWTARYLRDNRLVSIGGGADEVMLQVLARMDGLA
jgi:citronellyl-CoA dehydrogenase